MYSATAKKLTESTGPSALLLLSEYRRVARAAQLQARSNPILLVACVAIGLVLSLLSLESGRATAALLSAFPDALVATTLLLMLLGFFVGGSATSASPRLEDFDEQFQTVPASRRAMAIPLTLIPVMAITIAVASALSLFMFGVYTGMGLDDPWILSMRFGIWVVAAGAAGSAWASALLRSGRHRLFCLMIPIVLATVGQIGVAAFHAPWWASVATFPAVGAAVPGTARSVLASISIPATAGAVSGASVWLWLWLQGKGSPRPVRVRRHVGVPIGRPAPAAIAPWLTITLIRSRPYGRILYAPCVGLIVGIVLRAGFSGLVASMGPLIAAAILIVLVETPLCMSVPLRGASWLLKSASTSAWAVAAGWWIGASLVAAVVGLAGLGLALALASTPMDFRPLAFVPVASFAVAAAGRLVPWNDQSPAIQFLSSIAASLCVVAGIAFQVWSMARFGPLPGIALAVAALGVSSYVVCLAIETERTA